MNKLIIILLFSVFALSQNLVNFGFNRFNDNIEFTINGNVKHESKFGKLIFSQNYNGNSTILGNQINHNDNQNLNFQYSYPLGIIDLNYEQRLIYVGDNYSDFASSSLFNTQEIIGSNLVLNPTNKIRLYYGMDNHDQLAVRSLGSIYGSQLDYGFKFDNWNIFGDAGLERVSRSLDRSEDKNQLSANLLQSAENNSLKISGNYSSLGNNLLRLNNDSIDIENRLEDNYNLDILFDYQLSKKLRNSISLSYFDFTRENSFQEFDPNISKSGIDEQRSQRSFRVNNKSLFQTEKSILSFEVEYYDERMINSAVNKNLDENDFRSEVQNLSLLDYNNYYTRMILTSENKISDLITNRTLLLNEINRFDTPSDRENRDRDQLIMRVNNILSYNQSKYFTANFEFDGRFRHLVFLKSEFSSDNKWERILKLSPFFRISYNNFHTRPRFELFVRYNSFDFQEISTQVRSDAQRILRISDTLDYNFDRKFSIRSQYYYLYKETGRLDWKNFKQSIDEIKNEVFVNCLIYLSKDESDFGFGLRYYYVNNSIETISPVNRDLNIVSISPETDISWDVGNFTKLRIAGWFEFQDRNGELITIPNLFLQTELNF